VGRAIGQSRSVPSGAGDGGDMERAVELGIRSKQLRGGIGFGVMARGSTVT
jgi:hypothetical protein